MINQTTEYNFQHMKTSIDNDPIDDIIKIHMLLPIKPKLKFNSL
jgi:hypothetical protein